MIEFRLIGPVELWVGQRKVDLGPARQRGVLAALLVEPDRSTSIQLLIDRVWGDSPPSGVRSVIYTYITRLRKLLADATEHSETPVSVCKDAAGYRLDIGPDMVDLARFHRLLDRARAVPAGDPRRRDWLGQALRLWRGEALAGLNSDWAERFRETLLPQKYEALTEWADAELGLGNTDTVIGALRHALLEAPFSEPLHERLLYALYSGGRRAEALSQYEYMRRLLAEELGADPGPSLQAMQHLMLQGEPLTSLYCPVAEPAAPVLRVAETPEPPADPQPRGPDLLPMGYADFSGRDQETEWVLSALTADASDMAPVVTITGGPGVGKSALAITAGHRLRHAFPDGRLYVDLRGSGPDPADSRAVLARLLRALGMDSAQIPDGLDERAELYRNRLTGRRVLVVLDDAADEDQVHPLLPGGPGCAVMVTSRTLLSGLSGARFTLLRELLTAQGVEMLARVVGRERVLREQQAAVRLVRYCCGLPLALRAVANRLISHPHWTLQRMLDRIADEDHRLDELAYGTLDLRASLEFSYQRLDPSAAQLLHRLVAQHGDSGYSLVPGPGPEATHAAYADAFDQLVDFHFLQVAGQDSAGRILYRLHDLHRIYARGVARAAGAGAHTGCESLSA
ncbi:BTAD domain-containing putative transcriptional regulator [Streptomyces sp. DG2A-72]|uniref:AfsR/SARP family transcriptional regulator n=1 Tax=Streptomyces sp. DG2A-72 TaxID=3051386 RepID=UPI00265C462F|nr:BTAD domain-containing putative transcriptional regulator [Streptomyces sp. DG2A-72]MDO0937267.1 BTAD domain-containing putative transcriptional regulator [Streptomyces sp. DG2A-72]